LQNKALEESNLTLTHDLEHRDKEIKKLKQTIELKETAIDEYR